MIEKSEHLLAFSFSTKGNTMALFFPTTSATRACHITAKRLGRMGVKGLILDIDNTLTSHDAPEPEKAILDWLEQMKRDGIRLILLSNNHPPRVQPFADRLGLAFEADGKKPLPAGYRRAAAAMGLSVKECAVVGDQIFTDILGANLAGMPSILVTPIDYDEPVQIRFKRVLEKPILWCYGKIQKEGGGR